MTETKAIIYYDLIKDIMNELAETGGKIFANEAQFQFAFTLGILNKQLPGCEIVVEYPYKDRDRRKYIDLVVFFSEGGRYECYPIELKYKTAGKEIEYRIDGVPYYTYNQGAYDIGSYDYINDISRLEEIGKRKALKYKDHDYYVRKGFALLLTNGSGYYKGINKESYYWQRFSLAGHSINKNLYWINPETKEKDSGDSHGVGKRGEFKLKREYSIIWEEYPIKTKPEFKYMITEVPCESL